MILLIHVNSDKFKGSASNITDLNFSFSGSWYGIR